MFGLKRIVHIAATSVVMTFAGAMFFIAAIAVTHHQYSSAMILMLFGGAAGIMWIQMEHISDLKKVIREVNESKYEEFSQRYMDDLISQIRRETQP